MRRMIAAVLLGLLVSSPSWSEIVGPCPPGTTIPVTLRLAPPICPGQPLNLVARACGPCLTFLYSTPPGAGPMRIVVSRDYRMCITTVCEPESLVVPLGTFASGHHAMVVEVFEYNLVHDSTTCTVSRLDTLNFDVPLACAPTRPLPYTDWIRVGPPPPCAGCPPPPICAQREIPFAIAGTLPNSCWRFSWLELIPAPNMGPLPMPPTARVHITRHAGCLNPPCDTIPYAWQAQATLPPLFAGRYEMNVELVESSACDSTGPPDSVYATRVAFGVIDSCGTEPGPACYLPAWGHATANPECETFVAPGMPAREMFRLWTGTPLGGLQGKLSLDPSDLQIVALRPAGIAAGMRIAWNPTPNGANFVLFSTDGATIRSTCVPPAMCPPTAEPTLEVVVAQRPGVAIPAVTQLHAFDLLAADTLGREVLLCPNSVRPLPARICAGRNCDFNADGRLDVRDLVLMARCVTGQGACPDSTAGRYDCNGDGVLGVDDVLCCARVILHGPLPDSLATRPAPGLAVHVGTPTTTATGLDVPVRVSGANVLGAARLALSYPAARFDRASVEMLGDASSWLQVSEAADGEMIVGLIATTPAEQVPARLDFVLHFGLAAGQAVSTDVRVVGVEFVAPDGAVLALATPPTGAPNAAAPFRLSAPRPNPFAGETRVVLTLTRAAEAELAIFDLAGRRVATLHRGPLDAGDHEFTWDGTRSDGSRARGGVYFCRVVGAGASEPRRVILLGER